jgi:5-methylcytosine-specific restriction enzyme A
LRHEFTKKTKAAALERSGGRCEAVGERYGHPAGERCERAIGRGKVNYDHFPRGAHDPHPETRTVGNCVATCPQCNQFANNKFDTPREAKMKDVTYEHAVHQARMKRKAGLDVPDPKRHREKKPRPKMKGPGFRRGGPKQKIPTRPFPKRTS